MNKNNNQEFHPNPMCEVPKWSFTTTEREFLAERNHLPSGLNPDLFRSDQASEPTSMTNKYLNKIDERITMAYNNAEVET